jgi:hypothetical protein
MNFNGYTTIALGLIQIHIIHKNGYKENMKFELFQFAHNMLRKQFRVLILKWLLSSLKEPSRRERERRGKEGKMRGTGTLSKAWKTIISGQSDFLGQKFNKLGKQFRQCGRRNF